MSPIERNRRIAERSAGFNAAKRTKQQLARTVESLIASRPDEIPEQLELSTPLLMRDEVSRRLAKVILRLRPEEVTDRMADTGYDVSLGIDTSVEPPLITAILTPKQNPPQAK